MTSEKSVMDKRWYVVHTYSGHENKVKTNLERTIKNAGAEEKFGQILVATEDFAEMKDGKRVEGFPFGKDRLLFSSDEAEKLYDNPGYAWLRQQLDESVGDIGNFMKP